MGSIIRHCHVSYWHHYGARVTPQQIPTLRNGNFSISEIVALNQKKYLLRVISDRVFLEIKKTLLRNTAMGYKHINIDELAFKYLLGMATVDDAITIINILHNNAHIKKSRIIKRKTQIVLDVISD